MGIYNSFAWNHKKDGVILSCNPFNDAMQITPVIR